MTAEDFGQFANCGTILNSQPRTEL